jgi:hypothetical protein
MQIFLFKTEIKPFWLFHLLVAGVVNLPVFWELEGKVLALPHPDACTKTDKNNKKYLRVV